ncbi:MFS monosaccharide transporter [Mycena floridula]|nr:MFS monosaccharide transporter [Mycena floridula]
MPGGPVAIGGGLGGGDSKNQLAGIAMTAFSAFGGILYGYDTGVISGIKEMPDWLKTFGKPTGNPHTPFGISSSTESLVVSILSAGTFFGALLGAPAADILGRKYGIILACAVFLVGVIMQTAATKLPLFVVGRVFAGLGVGLVSCIVPMYQSECSPKWIRGAVVASYQWCITIGLLLAAIVNNSTQNRPDHSSYRIPIVIQCVWGVVLAGGMLLLPESPRWLAAIKSMRRLTGSDAPELALELESIRANLEHERSLGESSYLDCFKPSHNKIALRTWTGIALQGWQQLTGINFVFYFGTTFFTASGIQKPFIISIVTNVVNVCMTVPGMWAVDRFGRRRLLLIGAAGMCFCEYLVAIVGTTVSLDNLAAQKVLVAFVCFYIAFFAATWGPIAWVITGEIFPLQVRAKAMSMSTASNWLWNFGIGYATPYLVNTGAGNAGLQVKVFFIWGTTCLGCLIFTYFCIPETKGLSLEQIDLMYETVMPLQSHEFRSRLQAGEFVSSSSSKGVVEHDHKEHTGEEKV